MKKRTQTCISVLIAAIAALYAVSAFVWSGPVTPIRTDTNDAMSHYMVPFFDQKWTLFAPTPPDFNETAWLQFRYSVGGQVRTSPTYSLTKMINGSEGQTLSFIVSNRPRELSRAEMGLGLATRSSSKSGDPTDGINATGSTNSLARSYYLDVLQILASENARYLNYPGTITQVRVFMTDQQISPYKANARNEAISSGGDTGWMPYTS